MVLQIREGYSKSSWKKMKEIGAEIICLETSTESEEGDKADYLHLQV